MIFHLTILSGIYLSSAKFQNCILIITGTELIKFWWVGLIYAFITAAVCKLIFIGNVKIFKVKQQELEHTIEIKNKELNDRNELFAEQSEELRSHAENLKKTNDLLTEKQALIEKQQKELIKTNIQLSQLNATKDKYFSIIAHDLRNTFHVVLGFAELLMADKSKLTEEKSNRYLQLIYSTSKNGNYLLENLLQWSRSQTGRMNFEPNKSNLLSLIEVVF